MRLLLACSIAVSICAAGALAQTSSSVATRQVGTATLENVPEIPADVAAAVQRYQNYRAASFQDWLAGRLDPRSRRASAPPSRSIA